MSIGSNIDPANYVPQCLQLLKKEFPSVSFSSIYETSPVGKMTGGKFWNLAARIESSLCMQDLREKLRAIEKHLGRVRIAGNKFAPRTIDIDILPQENYQQMAFIMIPLAEIVPFEKDPQTKKSFAELAREHVEEGKNFKKISVGLK